MSGEAGQHPGRVVTRLMRASGLWRSMWQPARDFSGLCLHPGCPWEPVGRTPHNIGRECQRHATRYGHRTQTMAIEFVMYRRATAAEILDARRAATAAARSSGHPESSGDPA